MKREELKSNWEDSKEQYCLCVGAGVTSCFIGDWTKLLSSLTRMRYLSKWRQANNNDDLEEYLKNYPSVEFFPSANVLEQGEYLLVDDNDDSKFISSSQELRWREHWFMQQVHTMINNNIDSYIYQECDGRSEKGSGLCCSECKVCAHRIAGKLTKLNDYYTSIVQKNDTCKRKKALSTIDAILRLCFSGRVQHLVIYNFDAILETLIMDEHVQGFYKSKYGLIGDKKICVDLFTYGDYEPATVNSINYHYGVFPRNYDNRDKESIRISTYHVHGVIGGEHLPLVFSEHSYIEYGELYFNWSNQILLDMLTRYNFMTVGFSGTDSNFRSLTKSLKRATESQMFGIASKRNRIVLTLSEVGYKKHLRKAMRDMPDNIETTLIAYYREMVDLYYRNYFNIDIWWSKDYDELAENIRSRAESSS